MRLIDADALVALIQQEPTDGMYTEEIVAVIAEQPTIEAAPVVHGRWARCGGDLHSSGYAVYCSACHKNHFVHYRHSLGGLYGCKELFERPKYCPSCGAIMEEGNDL